MNPAPELGKTFYCAHCGRRVRRGKQPNIRTVVKATNRTRVYHGGEAFAACQEAAMDLMNRYSRGELVIRYYHPHWRGCNARGVGSECRAGCFQLSAEEVA